MGLNVSLAVSSASCLGASVDLYAFKTKPRTFVLYLDEFSALYLLFVTFILYCQDGSAASVQVDMQIEAAARLKSTLSDLSALEISRNISFGPPPPIFGGLPASICLKDPYSLRVVWENISQMFCRRKM